MAMPAFAPDRASASVSNPTLESHAGPEGTGTDSLRPFFEPATVAVIGAGRERGGIGAEIFRNLIGGGFTGSAIPINPRAPEIQSTKAYASVKDVPGPVDLAVIAVPSAAVEGAFEDCLTKGVPAVIIISAGFGETGEEGRQREERLRRKARSTGVRVIGPNCMGLVNTDPAFHLNATFAPGFPPSGGIAFSSQSGALGLAILEYARHLNLGFSSFVSVGNKADVSSNDLLEYWELDSRTRVILLYLESFGNPRRFGPIARRVGRHKPIIAVKAGRSRAGARAAASHTGALASSDRVVDALFHDAGVIRTSTLEELFETGALLAHQPLPAGPRVAILSNAGGPGILAADACEALGLQLPLLSPATLAALRSFLPAASSVANPVDMLATAPADDYRRAIPLLLADPAVDSLLTIFIPPLVTSTADVARAIAETSQGSDKPVLATFFGAEGVAEILSPVPCYTFPESAARALGHAVRYAAWRGKLVDASPVSAGIDIDRAREITARTLARGGGWLSPADCCALLFACGIPAAPTRVVANRDALIDAAREVGYPVVLKGWGPAITHKSDAHAVFTGLADPVAVVRAFDALDGRPEVAEIYMQPMVDDGVEMLVGAVTDPVFGPLVLCGGGGTLVELLNDVSCRLAPVSEPAAREMLDELRSIVLLRGFRGAPPGDEAALRDVVQRISALVVACPEIVELDLNPVLVTPRGVCVVDARVRVGGTEAAAPLPG
jgi:acetyl coenzyme A synthetase (ADP forming)-like protein